MATIGSKIANTKILSAALMALLLAGCAHTSETTHKSHHGFASAATDPFAGKGSAYYRGKAVPFGGGKYHVGSAYQVAGRWFKPSEQPNYDKVGTASWYGEAFHRRRTSNGEYFDMNTLTAAHATLPLPSYVMVTNLDNNRKVIVRVNDRGPFVGTRIIDLSKRAADVLGYRGKGKTTVRVRLLGPAPINDSMGHMVAMNNAMNQGASMNQLVAMSGNTAATASETQVADAEPTPAPRARRPVMQAGLVQTASFSPPPRQPQAFMVRVAVFHDLAQASQAKAQLASFGPTNVVKGVGANGPLYRVEIGPLNSAEDAQSAVTTAQGEGYGNAQVVPVDPLQISMK